MATSFFSRWSKLKLEEATTEHRDVEASVEIIESEAPQTKQNTEAEANVVEATAASEHVTTTESTNPEEMSVAQLLVSEASESVKKAALRKLFLSEEFNVRDGLDDYDDDYSNLKSLSEGVADTLREWVKEKTEEEPAEENVQAAGSHEESGVEVTEAELTEGAEIPEEQKELYVNTVHSKNDTTATKLDLEEVGQNIPHKQ